MLRRLEVPEIAFGSAYTSGIHLTTVTRLFPAFGSCVCGVALRRRIRCEHGCNVVIRLSLLSLLFGRVLLSVG